MLNKITDGIWIDLDEVKSLTIDDGAVRISFKNVASIMQWNGQDICNEFEEAMELYCKKSFTSSQSSTSV